MKKIVKNRGAKVSLTYKKYYFSFDQMNPILVPINPPMNVNPQHMPQQPNLQPVIPAKQQQKQPEKEPLFSFPVVYVLPEQLKYIHAVNKHRFQNSLMQNQQN